MKDAIELNIELNKILTICRDNIKNIEVYKNSYNQNKIQKPQNTFLQIKQMKLYTK